MSEISIPLKTALHEANGEPIYEWQKLAEQKKFEKMSNEEYQKHISSVSKAELKKDVPIFNLANGITSLLNGSQPKTASDSAELYMWIRRVNNNSQTNKGVLKVTRRELEELLGILKPITANISPMISGQTITILEELLAKDKVEGSKK